MSFLKQKGRSVSDFRQTGKKTNLRAENLYSDEFENVETFTGKKATFSTFILGLIAGVAGMGLFIIEWQDGWFNSLYLALMFAGAIIALSSFSIMKNAQKMEKQRAKIEDEQFYNGICADVISLFDKEGFNTKTRAKATLEIKKQGITNKRVACQALSKIMKDYKNR